MARISAPINFKRWIQDNRPVLKPPVGNKLVWEDTEFIIMVIGGPNARKDFHVDEGEEFFYQVEGDITLSVMEAGTLRHIPIKEGEIFLLPPKVPHSPQRPPNTVGLVVERQRREDELDGFQWYCERCGQLLYEEFLHVTDLVTQLPPIFERFFGSDANRTCDRCGAVMERPEPAEP